MGWLRIDDEFEDHPKVAPLSDAAHRLWSRAACWCRKPKNAHTLGFVPRVQLESIARKPLRVALRLAKELVEADGGGMFEHGLWEARDDGWQFHDWEQYQPSNPTVESETDLSEKRSRAGRKGAAARWGSSKPGGKQDGNVPSEAWQTDGKPMATKCPPSPSPSATGSTGEEDPKDLPGSSRASPPGGSSPSSEFGEKVNPDAGLPHQRADVARIVEAFATAAELPSVKIRRGDARGVLVAEAIDQFGEDGCLAIIEEARRDDTVNGRGEAAGGATHWTLEYVFKATTSERLFAAATARKRRRPAKPMLSPAPEVMPLAEVVELLETTGLVK